MIIAAEQSKLNVLLDLWAEYQTFYKVAEIDRTKNKAFVESILAQPDKGRIHLILEDDVAVGFSTLYFTFASTVSSQVAVLNDLYVCPDYRQQGKARRLLEHAKDTVQGLEIPYMRWMTQDTNKQAQQLYKNYSEPSEWLVYALKCNE